MAITPAGRCRTQINQGGFKHESIFNAELNQLLRKIGATGTNIEEESVVDPQLQDAAASPQLTDPSRNIPNIETKAKPQIPMAAPTASPGNVQPGTYPSMPGTIDSLPPTQRAVAELLLQKAKEQGLIVEGFQPKVKSFDFQDGNVININISNGAGAKISPGGRV